MSRIHEAVRAKGLGGLLAAGLLIAVFASAGSVLASVWTDRDDYPPGETVTVSGDNTNDAGYLPGETVIVDVTGPNGFAASCEAVADESGAWSCQITLWDDDRAIGAYHYTATGVQSGASESGAFTDARNWVLVFAGTGGGSVTITPASGTVNAPAGCGGTGTNASAQTVTGTCSPNISTSDNNTVVTFSATAGAGSAFAGWSDPQGLSSNTCVGTANPCSAVIGSNASLTVTFNAAATSTPTFTPTHTPTNTSTHTPTHTPTNTPTHTPTFTPTHTPTPSDTTPPEITPNVSCDDPGNAGWCKGTITVTWSVTDAESTVSSTTGCGPTTISSDTPPSGTTLTCTATSWGGTDSESVTAYRDGTAPSVGLNSGADSCDTPGLGGWCRGTQTAGFSASDATSGMATPCAASPGDTCYFTQSTSSNGSAVSIPSGPVCDVAGNCDSGISAGPYQIDSAAPSISCPSDLTFEGNTVGGYSGAILEATATDAVDGAPSVSRVPAGSYFALGTTPVTWTAEDDAGNSASCGADVIVQDTTAPSIAAPSDQTEEGNTAGGWTGSIGAPVVTDVVDPSPVVTNDAPGLFPLGTTTVTWTATDASGNSASDTQDITVIDTTPPVIACPGDQLYEGDTAGGYAGGVVDATASDIVDAWPLVTSDAPGLFALGATTVTWTATDSSGNSSSCSNVITVQDTTPPSITAPLDQTEEGNTTGGWVGSIGAPVVTDVVDPSPVVTNDAPGLFPLGTTTVTWMATDASGNSASDTQDITVVDTTAPSITCPPDITGLVGQPVSLGSPLVSDIVDPSPAVSNDAPGSFGPGTTIVTWTATDGSGNLVSCAQSVTLTYVFSLFRPPVDNPPVVNLARAGSTIPVKWQLRDYAGAYVRDLSAVVSIKSAPMACGAIGWLPADEIETTATGGTSLRYDLTAEQYVYNWATLRSWAGTCRVLVVTFDDGTSYYALFKFK